MISKPCAFSLREKDFRVEEIVLLFPHNTVDNPCFVQKCVDFPRTWMEALEVDGKTEWEVDM